MKFLAVTVILQRKGDDLIGELTYPVPRRRADTWEIVRKVFAAIADKVNTLPGDETPTIGLYFEIDAVEKADVTRRGFWNWFAKDESFKEHIVWREGHWVTESVIMEGGRK